MRKRELLDKTLSFVGGMSIRMVMFLNCPLLFFPHPTTLIMTYDFPCFKFTKHLFNIMLLLAQDYPTKYIGKIFSAERD